MSNSSFRLLLRLCMFLTPLALYFVPTLLILTLGGELTSPSEAARMQQADPTMIYGRLYEDDFPYFKLVSSELHAPEVLALGSSRVMQFRAGMFSRGNAVFYNAGGGASTMYSVPAFLRQVPPADLPKVLIVGLDQDWFQPDNAKVGRGGQPWTISPPRIDLARVINLTRLLAVDMVNQKRPYDQVFRGTDPIYHARAVGINAITTGSGFRSDGSYLAGPEIYPTPYTSPNEMDTTIASIMMRIRDGCCRFQYGDVPDNGALEQVKELMRFCHDNGIALIIFSPPYAPSVYARMVEAGQYSYIFKTNKRLSQIANKFKVQYYDFMDGSRLGTDAEFLDGLHGSETIYLRMLLQMVDDPHNPLRPYVDSAHLKAVLATPRPSPLEVFGPNGP